MRGVVARQLVCLSHKRYETERAAKRAVTKHTILSPRCTRCARPRVYFRAFACDAPGCEGWHVGHKTVRM